MSALALNQTKTALAPGCIAYFLGNGGTAPYVYSVLAGGAGGSINSSTGVYTAPSTPPSDPTIVDTVRVTDHVGAIKESTIVVGYAIILLREIIKKYMGITDDNRLFFWNQKQWQPTDSNMYIFISVPGYKVIGNNLIPGANGTSAENYVTMAAMVDINIVSRGPDALLRNHEVIMALNSTYSQSQQVANSFLIGRIPTAFTDLSGGPDGAAIPYRFHATVNVTFGVSKTEDVEYFTTPAEIQVNTNP